MPQMLQRPADDQSPEIQPGAQFDVHERFVGLQSGQQVEVTVVSDDTTADGEYPEQLTLRLAGPGTPSTAPSEMVYHGSDIKRAVEAGGLELQ